MSVDEAIGRISAKTKISRADVLTILLTASVRYKIYKIKKRDKTDRVIAHPSRELKAIQRAVLDLFPKDIPLHSASHAYEQGCSIKKNATAHAKNVWIAKFDLENFFNSIKSDDWAAYLSEIGCDDSLIQISKLAFFWKARNTNTTCLSVGAPSSPFVSNRFMYKFDEFIGKFADENGITYTRYADDLAFSSNNELQIDPIREAIQSGLAQLGNIKINDAKTRLIGPGRRKTVTGVILKDAGGISLGRSRKRMIEAMLHRYIVKGEDVNRDVLSGHLAFLRDIDPDGYSRLHKKYNLPTKGVGQKAEK